MSDNTLTRENQFYAEIAALRVELATITQGFKAKVAELAQRTAERDEARRIACSAYAEWRRDLATERNWDCWKKEVQP
jgi:hypothetical protein